MVARNESKSKLIILSLFSPLDRIVSAKYHQVKPMPVYGVLTTMLRHSYPITDRDAVVRPSHNGRKRAEAVELSVLKSDRSEIHKIPSDKITTYTRVKRTKNVLPYLNAIRNHRRWWN